jgi:hypothetical protein
MRIPSFLRRKDTVGALILMVLGAFVAVAGWHYRLGTLRNMGAGYAPFALGAALLAAGALIAALSMSAGAVVRAPIACKSHPEGIDVRAWVCVLAGIGAFVLLARQLGLVPAAFACVFVSALGDRANSMRDASMLAAAMAVVGYLVFNLALGLPLAPFAWGG